MAAPMCFVDRRMGLLSTVHHERRGRLHASSFLSRMLAKDIPLVISEFIMLTHLDDFVLGTIPDGFFEHISFLSLLYS